MWAWRSKSRFGTVAKDEVDDAAGSKERQTSANGREASRQGPGKKWSGETIRPASGFEFQQGSPAYSTSPSNVWFFGENEKTFRPEALVYNGNMTIDTVEKYVNGYIPQGPPLVYQTSGGTVSKVAVPLHANITGDSGIAAAPNGRLWILLVNNFYPFSGTLYSKSGNKWVSSATPAYINDTGTLSYDGKNGFWDGPFGHWTGSEWIDTQNDDVFDQTANVVVPIPGTDSAWRAGDVPWTPDGTATNAAIAIFGPLP
jgi:hypothetical protein